MDDFLKFLDTRAHYSPMHIEITYSKMTDWRVLIYKKGCGENDSDFVIVNEQSCDLEYCMARAQVAVKDWFLENEGGY